MQLAIVLSGPIAVGKSDFVAQLLKQINGTRVSTRDLILSLRKVPNERGSLQAAGDSLDHETDGQWVANALALNAENIEKDHVIIVDSIRIPKQIEHLRHDFPGKVKHIHLTASPKTLNQRFADRKHKEDHSAAELDTYQAAKANPTEAEIEKLGDIADLVINTDNLTAESAATEAIEKLGIIKNPPEH